MDNRSYSFSEIPMARPIGPPLVPWRNDELLLLGQTRRQAWADVLIFFVTFLAIDLCGEWAIAGIGALLTGVDEHEKFVLFPVLGWRAMVAATLIWWLSRRRGAGARSVGLTTRHMTVNVLLGLATLGGAIMLLVVIVGVIQILSPTFMRQFEENAFRIMERVPKVSPLLLAFVSLGIGFYEELVFRGFLMPRLRRATGSWIVAVVVSALIFTVPHLMDQTAGALIVVGVLALLFSVVTIWRRSLVPAIVAHALFNYGNFLSLYYQAGDQWK